MPDPLTIALATKLVETAASKGIDAVAKFFSREKKEDKPLMAIGLAVGYYYNFLEPVMTNIKVFNYIQLFNEVKKEDGTTEHIAGKKFDEADVKIQIILPKRLDTDAFNVCEIEFKQAKRGSIYLGAQSRYYGINYAETSLAKSDGLIIIDLARPLMAVKRYYEDVIRLDTFDRSDPTWLSTQITETTAFTETLRRLQARGYGGSVKIDFSERG